MVMQANQVTTSQTITTTTEKALLVTTPMNDGIPGAMQPIRIAGTVNITPGTGTTAVVIRVRQGNGITGTVVGSALTHTVTAGNAIQLAYSAEDTSSWLTQAGGGSYSVTVQQTGASGNGTVNFIESILEQLWLLLAWSEWLRLSPRLPHRVAALLPAARQCGHSSG